MFLCIRMSKPAPNGVNYDSQNNHRHHFAKYIKKEESYEASLEYLKASSCCRGDIVLNAGLCHVDFTVVDR